MYLYLETVLLDNVWRQWVLLSDKRQHTLLICKFDLCQ